MQARHLLQRHPIPMICHFDHGLDLRDGELAVGEIAAKSPISGPSVSRHLAILRAAGLVTERRAANRIYSALVTDRPAVSVGEFIASILRMPGVRRVVMTGGYRICRSCLAPVWLSHGATRIGATR